MPSKKEVRKAMETIKAYCRIANQKAPYCFECPMFINCGEEQEPMEWTTGEDNSHFHPKHNRKP